MTPSNHARHSSFTSRLGLSCIVCVLSLACSGTDETALDALHQPSICGETTDWQDVESYDGTLGPSVAFVQAHQSPVGKTNNGCSGTLIGPDLFLTAGHCSSATSLKFNYQYDPEGNPRTEDFYEMSALLEDSLGGVDYAIYQLNADAGLAWGVARLAAFQLPAGQPVTIIQHPSGLRKKVEGGTLQLLSSQRFGYDDLDTENGASGSGILQDSTGSLVGVHTHGAVDDACGVDNPNSGQSLLRIYAQSPIIRRIALDPAKLTAAI